MSLTSKGPLRNALTRSDQCIVWHPDLEGLPLTTFAGERDREPLANLHELATVASAEYETPALLGQEGPFSVPFFSFEHRWIHEAAKLAFDVTERKDDLRGRQVLIGVQSCVGVAGQFGEG